MSRATISVVMCTYNGSAYLIDQLQSFVRQSRPPDELIIFDDASKDETPEILKAFAEISPFRVRLFENDHNLGYRLNFETAMRHAEGDIIVLSDQDDVWYANKLSRLERLFSADEGLAMAFSDADLVDDRLRPMQYRLWDSAVQFTRSNRELVESGNAFEVLLKGNIVTGATMAFRRCFVERVVPVDQEAVHDAWIALLVAALGKVEMIKDPLIQYRQHAANQVGTYRTNLFDRIRRARSLRWQGLKEQHGILTRARSRMCDWPDVSDKHRRALDEAIEHLETRSALPRRRLKRLLPIGEELIGGRYRRRANGAASALRDLLV